MVALYIQTESGDSYVYAIEGNMKTEDLLEYIKEVMGEEFPWIGTMYIDQSKNDYKIDMTTIYDAVYAAQE